jgi:hypothetical protein
MEELFDLLWTLPMVVKTDVAFRIMEVCLLWQRFFSGHFLQRVFLEQMVDLFEKQDHSTTLISALAEQLRDAIISPRGPRRRVVPKIQESADKLGNWRVDVRYQAEDLQIRTKLKGLAQQDASNSKSNQGRDRHASELVSDYYTKLRAALAFISAAMIDLQLDQCIFLDEERP